MDPVTLALLLAGGLGAAQGVSGAFTNDSGQKRNKDELAKLMELEQSGNLGLTGDEQQNITNQFVSPIQHAATSMRTRQEQAQAATGGSSGQNLADLQNAQAHQIAQAQQYGAQQVQAQNTARRLEQKNEIEQRLGLKDALKRDDINAVLGGIGQLAGPIGTLAGAPPGTGQLSATFGQKFGADEAAQLADFRKSNPDEFNKLLDELLAASAGG